MSPAPEPLSPAERLDYIAFAHVAPMAGHAMNLSMLAGLSMAQAIGPRRLPDERLLPWVWDCRQGLRAPQFTSPSQREDLTGLVLRQLQPGHWDAQSMDAALLALTAASTSSATAARSAKTATAARSGGAASPAAALDAIGFCQGFNIAVNLGFEDWAPLLGSHPQGLLAIMTLGQPDPTALAQLDLADLKPLIDALAPDLLRWRTHWQNHPASAQAAWSGDAIWQHLRARLLHFSKPFPHDALLLAHAQRHHVAPGLVQALTAIAQDPADALAGEWMLQHFAMALLAAWREPSAYRPLLALARLDADSVDGLLGDALHELYGRALASVCDGDLQPLIDAVGDPGVGAWVKMALLDAWKLRVLEGDAPLAPFEQYLLAQGLAGAERLRRGEICAPGDAEMLDTVASLAGDVGSPLLLGPVRGWYAEGLLDPQHMDQPFFEAAMALPWAERVAQLRQRKHSYVANASDEIAWWASYTETDELDAPSAPVPMVRDGPKIGRNDPCPCGSGVKYKKCHGAN